MKKLPFVSSLAGVASLGLIAAFVACGGISDPTKGSPGERVATVSGALTGMTVPANTRVALVWRTGATGGYAVGSDVAVVNGKFAMDLGAPPDSYLFAAEGDYDGLSGSGSSSGAAGGPVGADAPPDDLEEASGSSSGSGKSSGQSFAFSNKLSPRDTVSGHINKPLSVAVAGFVVYVDTNGNGKLDLEGEWAKSTDDVIGGNKEIFLAYLRDGGALDYEKLRDRSGILPHAGYNLAWDEGRWLPLDVVDLKIASNTKLPSPVCSAGVTQETPPAPPSSSSSGGPGTWGYPDPSDPNLKCSPDGRSYEYTTPSNCDDVPAPAPAPEGLCALWSDVTAPSPTSCDPSGGYKTSIPEGEPVPDGWPCTVVLDGGAAPDAGE